jgi:2-polyprenyl-3-methyl-5-hydroxy-6-metoxy-1,4-benzoquinol methylase
MFSDCPICSDSKSYLIYEARLPIREYIREVESNYDELITNVLIVKCRECGHAYIQNYNSLPDVDLYSEAPIPANPVNPEMVNKLHFLLKWIGEDYLKNKRVLEIGSGSGHLARIIAQQAKSVTIVELNKSLNKELLPEENINLISEDYKYDESMGLFDLAICRQVIEHIPNPINFIKEINNCLKPDGHAYLEVPTADYIYTNNMIWDFHYQHIQYFTKSSFINGMNQAGLFLNKYHYLMDNHDMGFLVSNTSNDNYLKKQEKDYDTPSTTNFDFVIDKFKSLVNAINSDIAIYGANTHGQVFLNLMDGYDSNIVAALDDSKYLYDYYLFNTKRKIAILNPRSTDINRYSNVIITAYLHENSIRKNLNELGYKGKIYSINPNSMN